MRVDGPITWVIITDCAGKFGLQALNKRLKGKYGDRISWFLSVVSTTKGTNGALKNFISHRKNLEFTLSLVCNPIHEYSNSKDIKI